VLEELAPLHPVVGNLLEYRSLQKIKTLRDTEDPFVVLGLGRDVKLVIDRKQAVEAHPGILAQYNIKEDCSVDLREMGK